MKISELGEFGLIEMIAERVGKARKPVDLGVGDDASLLQPSPGHQIVTTTDMLVEGVHFQLEKTPPRDLGFKSLAVNISDLAAMGATPIQAFVSIGLPPGTEVDDVDHFYLGLLDAAGPDMQISGGDTVSSPSGWTISVTVIGQVPVGKALRRDAARQGDAVFLSGPLGDSAAGLSLILGKPAIKNQTAAEFLIHSHNRPRAQITLGTALSASGLSSCAIDVSDGFLQDLGHICESSHVGAKIEIERIPISPQMAEVARRSGVDPFHWPLTGGEDYSLIFTVPMDNIKKLEDLLTKKGVAGVCRIGKIVKGDSIELFRGAKPYALPGGVGYDHFRHQ